MKCLTICQPWAWAIVAGHKRVENRDWPTRHRGPLLIHAGKSKSWYRAENPEHWPRIYGVALPPIEDLDLGAIIGMATLCACLSPEDPRIADHPFTNGPVCWVVKDAVHFIEPIPYRGQIGLFDVPDELVAGAIALATKREMQR